MQGISPCPRASLRCWPKSFRPRAPGSTGSRSAAGRYTPAGLPLFLPPRRAPRTEPVICVSTFESVFGVSCARSERAESDSRRSYFSAIRIASSHVEPSGYAGPEAIISRGSPMMSESTTEKTLAGLASSANLPPFTPDSRLRMVFISTMSAPQARSCFVTSAISSSGISGHSKSAEPPPETRNKHRIVFSERPDELHRCACGAVGIFIRHGVSRLKNL